MNLLQRLIEPLLVASVKMPVNVFGVELASNRENLVFGEMCRIVDDFRADVAAKAAIQELLTPFARLVGFKGGKCRLDFSSVHALGAGDFHVQEEDDLIGRWRTV